MTTRILSLRILRLALASFIVGALAFAIPLAFISWLGVVGFGLAWLLVPGDRRWFIPATLVLVAAGFFWPRFRTFQYQLGDGSSITVNRLTGEAHVLPPNKFRTTTDWYRSHRSGWVQVTPTTRGSLLAYLGIKRRSAPPPVRADTFAAAIPAPPFMPNGGCIRSTNGGKWEPCPDFERSPLWPGQRVVWKDTIAVDRLADGRCDWANSTMKAPAKNLAAMIGERNERACRAVVYQIDMVTPPWVPPRSSQ